MRLGNILEESLLEMIASDRYDKFQEHVGRLPQECLDCQHFSICHGGCTDHRNVTVDGKHHEKYIYCGSRKRVFSLLEERLARLGHSGKEAVQHNGVGLVQLTILPKKGGD